MTVYIFGKTSTRKLNEVDLGLKCVAVLALSYGIMDFAVLERP